MSEILKLTGADIANIANLDQRTLERALKILETPGDMDSFPPQKVRLNMIFVLIEEDCGQDQEPRYFSTLGRAKAYAERLVARDRWVKKHGGGEYGWSQDGVIWRYDDPRLLSVAMRIEVVGLDPDPEDIAG